VAVLAPDMTQTVKVGPHVALAEPGVFHVGELVLPVGRPRRQAGRREDGLGKPRPEQRDAVRQGERHLDNLSFLNLGGGGFRDGGRDAVRRPGLVIWPPRRRGDQGLTVGLREGQRGGSEDDDGGCGDGRPESHATTPFARERNRTASVWALPD